MTDFDRIYPRQGTGAVKWDGVEEVFGKPNLHPMWVADMDFPPPPQIVQALKKRLEHPIFGYTMPSKTLYEAICAWQYKRYQWQVRQEWVLLSPGVVTSIAAVIQAVTDMNEKILMNSPIYPPFFGLTEAGGREVVYSSLVDHEDQYQINWEDFENKLKGGVKLFLLCHPHNPSGRVWLREELQRMVDLCKQYGVIILSDEIHCDLTLLGHTHIPIATVDPSYQDQIITLIAPSKTFNLAGLQASSMIISNEKLRTKIEAVQHRQGFHLLNIFGMVAMEAAYTQGETWLKEVLQYIQGNIQIVEEFLTEHLPEIKMKAPGATYLLWIDCRELGVNQDTLIHQLHEVGKLALEDGEKYGPSGRGFVRMNIACQRTLLIEGLKRFERAIASIR